MPHVGHASACPERRRPVCDLLAASSAPSAAPILLSATTRRSRSIAILRLVAIEFPHVDALVEIAQQVLAEVIGADPRQVLRFRPVAVPLPGQDHEIEAFIGLDEHLADVQRIAGVDVVIDIAGRNQQVPFQVPGDLRIVVDGVFEGDFPVFIRSMSPHWYEPAELRSRASARPSGSPQSRRRV